MIDSQTVRAADTVPIASSGQRRREEDQGPQAARRGRHRRAAAGRRGHDRSLPDRDGAFRITAAPREAFSTITLVWADARVSRPVRR
jgi:hypothetical protein